MSGEEDEEGPWRTSRHPAALESVMNSPDTATPSLSSTTDTLWTSYVAVSTQNIYIHNGTH